MSGICPPLESVEDPFAVCFVHPRAAIANTDRNASAVGDDRQFHGIGRRREFERVFDQIDQDALDLGAIDADCLSVGRELQLDSGGLAPDLIKRLC